MDPLTALAAFAPLLVDAGKGLIARFIAPKEFKPATIEQYTGMRRLELELFQAINAAGGSGPTYPWVEAIVRMQRPAVAAAVIGTWSVLHLVGTADTSSIDNFAAVIGFYLFGDRTLFHLKRAPAGAT